MFCPGDAANIPRRDDKEGTLTMSEIVPQIPPQKQCSKCLAFFPATSAYFRRCSSNRDGLQSQCKKCRGAAHMMGVERAVCNDGEKQCSKCLRILPHTEEYFRRHSKGPK